MLATIATGSVVLVLVLYFVPTIVAAARKVTNTGSVAVVNFFLGWTFVGWVVALAMACRTSVMVRDATVGPPPPPSPATPPAPRSPFEQ